MAQSPLRIAVVATGIDRGRLAVFEELAKQYGIDITIIRFTEWWWPSSDASHVRVVTSSDRGFKFPFAFVRDDAYIHFDPAIMRAAMGRNWDLLVCYGYGSFTTLGALIASKLRRRPVLLWSDARVEYEMKRHWLWRSYKRVVHCFGDHFLASGAAARLFLEATGAPAPKISIAPYAIDNATFDTQVSRWAPLKSVLRRELGIADDAVVLLYVGRLVPGKGVRDLMEAYAAVRREGNVALVIAGDGPDRPSLVEMATSTKDVHFLGAVGHERIGSAYALADVFVLPSYTDVWAKVINEACLFSLPVVTTRDVGAHHDLVRDGVSGYVVQTGSIPQLTSALRSMMRDESARLEMGSVSRTLVEPWTIDSAVHGFMQALTALGLSA